MGATKIEWADVEITNRVQNGSGYILARCPSYPESKPNGYVYEHRLVMARLIGRPLRREEVVHHINGDRSDNRPENLSLTTQSHHAAGHYAEYSVDVRKALSAGLLAAAQKRRAERITVPCACGCGASIVTPDKKGRDRRFVHGHNQNGRHWRWRNG